MRRMLGPTNTFSLFLLLFVIKRASDYNPVLREIRRKVLGMDKQILVSGEPGPIFGGCNNCIWGHCTPSIEGIVEVDISRDAQTLLKSLPNHLLGVNRDKFYALLTNILTTYSEPKRILLRKHLQQIGNKPLENLLRERLIDGSRLSQLMIALATPLPKFFEIQFEKAMASQKKTMKGGNGRIIVLEMLISLPQCLIQKVKDIYESNKLTFIAEIEGALKGNFSPADYIDIFKSLALCQREEGVEPSWSDAFKDARLMKKAIVSHDVKMLKTLFAEIFTKRPILHLKKTFQIYERLREKEEDFKSLEDDIVSHMDTVGEIYSTMARIIKDQPLYFASVFKEIFNAEDQDQPLDYAAASDRIIGLLRGRCDIDLGDIKEAYRKNFGKSLVAAFIEWEAKEASPMGLKGHKPIFRDAVIQVLGGIRK